MSNRKPPSSAPTAPGHTRPSTPPEQNNGVAKPASADDSQTQQIPRVTDNDKAPQQAPSSKSAATPAKPATPPAKSAAAPATPPAKPAAAPAKPAAKADPAPQTAKPSGPAKPSEKKVQRPSQPASKSPTAKAPEARSEVPTAGAIAADAETTKASPVPTETKSKKSGTSSTPKPKESSASSSPSRKARLRLVRFDPWSVMKTAFALSIALAIVTVVAVTLVWAVLDVAGVWDAINSSVATILSDNSDAFDVTDYVGFGRIIGFTILIAAIDVILITAIATIGAFLYNLAASLLGGLEITLAEDN